jgi:hypothetical protein
MPDAPLALEAEGHDANAPRVLELDGEVWVVHVDGRAWVGDPRDSRAPLLYLSFLPGGAGPSPGGAGPSPGGAGPLTDAVDPARVLSGVVAGAALDAIPDERLLQALVQSRARARGGATRARP